MSRVIIRMQEALSLAAVFFSLGENIRNGRSNLYLCPIRFRGIQIILRRISRHADQGAYAQNLPGIGHSLGKIPPLTATTPFSLCDGYN
jgi:hypothetical protein